MPTSSLLLLVEEALRARGAPLSAKALVAEIRAKHPHELGGQTPWKTVGARLAVDIRRNPASKFLRAGKGLYALREWPDITEAIVRPRIIHPLDEDILAVPRADFRRVIQDKAELGFYQVPYQRLLQHSVSIRRRLAEQSEDYIQLIPSFVVLRAMDVLSYKRTKKTPENRLHDSYSIVFGGHLQAEDIPELFSHDEDMIEEFVFREFDEELEIDPPVRARRYLGVIYLEESAFERQHAGLLFALDATPGSAAKSLEPGYHSNLNFVPWDSIGSSPIMDDRWSQVIIRLLAGNPHGR